jgi:pyruvate,water dikinase
MAEKAGNRPSFGSRLKRALRSLGRSGVGPEKIDRHGARFRSMYERFREILSLNDSVLQLIADIEDKLSGRQGFALEPMIQRVHRAAMDVFVMARNLNQMADNRYRDLFEVLRRVTADLDLECAGHGRRDFGPLVLPLEGLRATDAPVAGGKMANLGEVQRIEGLRVPEGFVITASAFRRFMARNNLFERAGQLESLFEMFSRRTFAEACRDVQSAISHASIPLDLENAILGAYDALANGRPLLVSMRSSAAGEDISASHAGLYYTELSVSRELLLDTYCLVIGSAFSPGAVAYRVERGLTDWEATMAVGCMRMLEPRCSGILFSRNFRDLAADEVVLSATAGLAARVAAGRQGAEEIVIRRGEPPFGGSSLLSHEDLARLFETARRLEQHFGSPQDIEWAIEGDQIYVLQARPMVVAPQAPLEVRETVPSQEPLLKGGYTACPGTAAGPVFVVRGDEDLDLFPQAGILVARHSSPGFSRVMPIASAIITDVGSPTGHMAILAREFQVPAIVGLENATQILENSRTVTVDAGTCRVYDGILPGFVAQPATRAPLADSPAVKRLRCLARFVTPLHLLDPKSREFSPSHCQTLHDITRFIHEKVYAVMFRIGDQAAQENPVAHPLKADLPLAIQVFDLGGAVADGAGASGFLRPEEIVSVPLVAFLNGLTDERIQWKKPRPVSARGFLSVLGEGLAGPPPSARGVGSASYAAVSDRYLNFSTKAGYHFSTIDAYCGQSQNKNYIHFRFSGGAAGEDRRFRRVQFLAEVLGHLDFKVTTGGDHLVARLEKYDQGAIVCRLTELGRLTMCCRQLDMLMDSDESPQQFAQWFLKGEFERF